MTELQKWAGLEPPMLDVLASNARTVLDEGGLMLDDGEEITASNDQERILHGINFCDDIIDLLNPLMETTGTFARTLTALGRHLADRVDRMENLALDDGEEVWGAAINAVSGALDLIDEAITALTPEAER